MVEKLVSILIPVYKSIFLEQALETAINQTYQNIEIIICDDSPNKLTSDIFSNFSLKYPNKKISYYKNEINLGAEKNYIKCFELAKGEYIKYLNDDDFLVSTCIEEMVILFEKFGEEVVLISSSRQLIDETGNELPSEKYNLLPDFVDRNKSYTYIEGKKVIDYTLSNLINQIGEPTTFMFRKKFLENIKPNILSLEENYILGNVDVTMCINLLTQGNFIFINKVLSYFRISPFQDQTNSVIAHSCHIHWFYAINFSKKLGFLTEKKEYLKALNNLTLFYSSLILKNERNNYINSIFQNRIKFIPIMNFLLKKLIKKTNSAKLEAKQLKELKIKLILSTNQIKNQKVIKKNIKVCPICSKKVSNFKPLDPYYKNNFIKYGFKYQINEFETLNEKEYLCKNCHASDRERLYALYLLSFLSEPLLFEKCNLFNLSNLKLRSLKNIIKSENQLKLLDFAPSSALSNFVKSLKVFDYTTADLLNKNVDDNIDICNMKYESNSFDFFICSHILEHVKDDNKALEELFRILKPNGKGILMVPICLAIENDIEYVDNGSIEEKWKYYGQDDHIRLYSKNGFINKITNTGFQIQELSYSFFGEETFKIFGITKKSILYIITKALHV